jgi:hypothetical protein
MGPVSGSFVTFEVTVPWSIAVATSSGIGRRSPISVTSWA